MQTFLTSYIIQLQDLQGRSVFLFFSFSNFGQKMALFAVQAFHYGGIDFQVIKQPITLRAATGAKITAWKKVKEQMRSVIEFLLQ